MKNVEKCFKMQVRNTTLDFMCIDNEIALWVPRDDGATKNGSSARTGFITESNTLENLKTRQIP